ncbi:hypothetical protein LZ30DRAFT_689020 [Colletotrichum cereale]|nr:hypothetical protein LZ30DRAFT_689020 [Colletotrichum cereale]
MEGNGRLGFSWPSVFRLSLSFSDPRHTISALCTHHHDRFPIPNPSISGHPSSSTCPGLGSTLGGKLEGPQIPLDLPVPPLGIILDGSRLPQTPTTMYILEALHPRPRQQRNRLRGDHGGDGDLPMAGCTAAFNTLTPSPTR